MKAPMNLAYDFGRFIEVVCATPNGGSFCAALRLVDHKCYNSLVGIYDLWAP